MADDVIINLLVMGANHSAPLSPDFLQLDSSKLYRVTFGDPALALMAKDQSEKFRLYPWLQAAEPSQQHELRHVVLPPSHSPVRDVSEWLLNVAGARWDGGEKFQILFGSTGPAIVVFNLRNGRPSAVVAAA